jgi:hypothetical protein
MPCNDPHCTYYAHSDQGLPVVQDLKINNSSPGSNEHLYRTFYTITARSANRASEPVVIVGKQCFPTENSTLYKDGFGLYSLLFTTRFKPMHSYILSSEISQLSVDSAPWF